MASITVKAPQGFPAGTTLSVYVDRVGDVVPQGPPVSTCVVGADSSVTVTGLTAGIPYQAGAVIGGTWRSFLVEVPIPAPTNVNEVIAELEAHEVDTTNVHGIDDTATLTTPPLPNAQTASYQLALTDASKTVELNAAGATVVTVPTNATAAFPIGTIIEVARMGAGAVSIAAAGGVTIRSRTGLLGIGNQYGTVSLRKRATDEWVLVGDLA